MTGKLVKLGGHSRIVRRRPLMRGVKEIPKPRQTWRIR